MEKAKKEKEEKEGGEEMEEEEKKKEVLVRSGTTWDHQKLEEAKRTLSESLQKEYIAL